MRRSFSSLLLPFIGMLCLILDPQTGLESASDGLRLCLQTVIPTLFPFLYLTASFPPLGGKRPGLSYFLLGAFGGYPAGAQILSQAASQGRLSKEAASRLLPVCNQTGPAFLFGIGAFVLGSSGLCLALWLIQLASALWIAWIIGPQLSCQASPTQARQDPLLRSLRSMALVCGWVILFRVLLGFCQQWFLRFLPESGSLLFAGMLELTGGCCQLQEGLPLGAKLLWFACFSCFGGLCVAMQVRSIAQETGISFRYYLPAKLTQMLCGLTFANIAQWFLPVSQRCNLPVWLQCLAIAWLVLFALRKKAVAFPTHLLYNRRKAKKRGKPYAVS